VIDPSIARSLWRLEIGGLVERPRSYTFAELSTLPATTQETTLSCISNGVGGGLISNAAGKGVSLRDLLLAAGPRAGAMEVLCHGADSYTDTFSWDKAMEPETMVVYEMNGEPLPERHGYPTRLIVPGLFGEKNVKWVTRIEVIDYDGKGFYEQQGWGPNFTVQTQTRIDSPNLRRPLQVNQTVALKGIAFAGDRGVAKVEVSVDDGKTWHDATLNPAGTRITWRLWSFDWLPTEEGEYVVVARTTDGTGAKQIEEARGSVPQGSTGIQRFRVQVQA
jgi:DMSO/TMAO reductase YedYZ molybdopterin-dependent catalytic subunit